MEASAGLQKLVNDGKLDLRLFKQECTGLKDTIQNILQLRKSRQPISSSIIGKYIVTLKAINRRTQLRIKDMRDATFQKKLAVDKKTRQLQNLLYELEHLKGSVRTCLEFRSLHDEIKLIPIDEYRKAIATQDLVESEHQQTLNRLYWELEQRKRLNGSIKGMSKSMAEIKESIAIKQAYLNNINEHLKNILEATRALDSDLGLNITENEEALQSAFLLPSPLYIIYSRLCAYFDVKGLHDRVSVKIVGDLDLARSINSASSSYQEEVDEESSEPEEQYDGLTNRKKSHRKSKRPRNEEEERSQHKIDLSHPLSVVVRITTGPDAKWANQTLTLTFDWLMRTQLISVKEELHEIEKLCSLSQTAGDLLSSEGLLSHLQCGGEATRWQGETAAGVNRVGTGGGKTYAWAQQLGGLQSLPHLESTRDIIASTSKSYTYTEPFGFIDVWFAALSRRLEARMSLNAEIHAIESGVLHLSESQKPFFPISKDIGLSTWDRVNFEDISTLPRAQTFIALDLIQPTDAFFKCQMAFHGQDVLTIGASIPASYPDDPSIIFMACNTNAFPAGDLTAMHIQELETEVNCYWREMPQEDGRTGEESGVVSGSVFGGKKPENLLTCQLARITSCLPIFLSPAGSENTGDIGSLCPQGGVKYRTRSRPLKFLPRRGIFTYR